MHAGVYVVMMVLMTGGLVAYENFLSRDSTADVLLTAWITASFVCWVSAGQPEVPTAVTLKPSLGITHPRMRLAMRAVRAFIVALPLFGDVFCSTSAEWLSAWVNHNTNAEQSLRCAGGTIGWIIIAIYARQSVFNTQSMKRYQIVMSVIGGLTLSIGPALALRDDMNGRGLSAAVACMRLMWLLITSSQFQHDIEGDVRIKPVMRVVFWAAVIGCFTINRPQLVTSGVGLGVTLVCAMKAQSPLGALGAMTAAGGILSYNTLQLGITMIPLVLIVCSRHSCDRTSSFHKLEHATTSNGNSASNKHTVVDASAEL